MTTLSRLCGHCGRYACEQHGAVKPSVWTERAFCRCGKPVVGNEWHMCVDTIRRFGDENTPVSLPNQAEHEPAQSEETQEEGSGWRSRPPML